MDRLLILNLPLVGVWARILKIPEPILLSLIVVLSAVGVYSVSNDLVEVWIMFVFGIIGYFMKKFDFPPGPVVLCVVLTPLMERALQQSLIMSQQKFSIFFTRPISLILLSVTIISLLSPLVRYLWPKSS